VSLPRALFLGLHFGSPGGHGAIRHSATVPVRCAPRHVQQDRLPSYEQFTSLVRQAQGSAGLMRFLELELELDSALALDLQAQSSAGRRLVRLIAGNPVTMGEMTGTCPTQALTRRSPSSSRSCQAAEPALPMTPWSASWPSTTTRPQRKSPQISTPKY